MIDTRSQDPVVFKELRKEQRVRQKGKGQEEKSPYKRIEQRARKEVVSRSQYCRSDREGTGQKSLK